MSWKLILIDGLIFLGISGAICWLVCRITIKILLNALDKYILNDLHKYQKK